MKASPRQKLGRPPLDLYEDAVHLLREAPLGIHLTYQLGAAPFLLGLLWFWTDMTRGAYADLRCAPGALGLAILFLWMKTCQSVFAARLERQLRMAPDEPWTAARWLRILATQAAIQPWGLILLPVSCLALLLPTPWVFACLQSATVTADASQGSAVECLRRAVRNGCRWPGQNHGLVGLLIVIAFGVTTNVAVALATAPYLARTLLGVESDFTLTIASLFNTTFLLAVVGLAYLVLDPLVKTVHVLRCFEGEALHTADDLRAGLKRLRLSRRTAAGSGLVASALLGALLLVGPGASPAVAQTPPPAPVGVTPPTPMAVPDAVAPTELNQALDSVLDRPDYTWRAPRELSPEEPDNPNESRLVRWLRGQAKSFSAFLDRNAGKVFGGLDRWLRKFFSTPTTPNLPTGKDQVDWATGLRILVILVLVIGVAWIGWILFRFYQRRRPRTAKPQPVAVAPLPDLTQEQVSADQLPEDDWLAMARDLASRGDLRLALRAVYLASLAHLARRELIRLAPFKTNRDYQRELTRRAGSVPGLPAEFAATAGSFDRVWYGAHAATPELLSETEAHLETMRKGSV
jgi:hypothetical protein